MKALITGAAGLIGTEACEQFAREGYEIVGIDNDLRATFFGKDASNKHNLVRLREQLGDRAQFMNIDIRDRAWIERLFEELRPDVVIHTAAQPSHDWAARDPHTDFGVNASGTLNLLQAARLYTPESPFIHCSTSKVYGDRPNSLPLEVFEAGTRIQRLDLPEEHPYYEGIDTTMSVDLCTHSLFGVSKLAGDLLVQEYGRYFDMPTVCFRPGCLTGGNHAGTEMHGFLSYLMRCAIARRPYTIYGYCGLQVRCNIHSNDLVAAFRAFVKDPDCGVVYNIGGGRRSNCSMWEAIRECEQISGHAMDVSYETEPRIGDHRWWISSNAAFEARYPRWQMEWTDTTSILEQIHAQNVDRWSNEVVSV